MARKLRIQFGGAIYHVINRGNYRRDLFAGPGEAQAFLATVRDGAERMGWRVHAYVLMRNHYHLAVETPEPNLVLGMHWLQSTWASRFNRFRKENGHLFQGRYRAILIENVEALGKVVDYIHLNPVRAKILPPEQVKNYRWSSLAEIVKGASWVDDAGWRAGGRFSDGSVDRAAYGAYLGEVGKDEARWDALGLTGLSKGWAIGTSGWRRMMAKEHGKMALNPGLERGEVEQLREALWESTVTHEMERLEKTEADLALRPLFQPWKIALAWAVREKCGASAAWLGARLALGKPASVRSYLCRYAAAKNQQTTA